MSEEYEVHQPEGVEGGEVSAEAVERLAEELRESAAAGQRVVKREENVRAMEDEVVQMMVRVLLNPGNATLAKLMAKALREGSPAPLVLAVASLTDLNLMARLPEVEVVVFDASIWPEEYRERMVDWEKTLVASLEHCLDNFHAALAKNGGELPNLAGMMDYCIRKAGVEAPVNGGEVVAGLVRLTEDNET